LTEEFIGLKPNESIVGIRIQEAKEPEDPGAFMLGKIGFVLASPA